MVLRHIGLAFVITTSMFGIGCGKDNKAAPPPPAAFDEDTSKILTDISEGVKGVKNDVGAMKGSVEKTQKDLDTVKSAVGAMDTRLKAVEEAQKAPPPPNVVTAAPPPPPAPTNTGIASAPPTAPTNPPIATPPTPPAPDLNSASGIRQAFATACSPGGALNTVQGSDAWPYTVCQVGSGESRDYSVIDPCNPGGPAKIMVDWDRKDGYFDAVFTASVNWRDGSPAQYKIWDQPSPGSIAGAESARIMWKRLPEGLPMVWIENDQVQRCGGVSWFVIGQLGPKNQTPKSPAPVAVAQSKTPGTKQGGNGLNPSTVKMILARMDNLEREQLKQGDKLVAILTDISTIKAKGTSGKGEANCPQPIGSAEWKQCIAMYNSSVVKVPTSGSTAQGN